MRLDSNKGDKGYTTYHAERCQVLRHVVWVDDEQREWCQRVQPFRFEKGVLRSQVHAARCILILPAKRLVIINPVGLGERWASRGDVLVNESLRQRADHEDRARSIKAAW